MGLASAVRECLEKYPMNFEFGLWDIKKDLLRIDPKTKRNHGDTVSRRIREFRYGDKWGIICIKPHMSRYKKVSKKEAVAFYKA